MLKYDKNATQSIQSKLIQITRQFLNELGRDRAADAISISSSLDKDLTIDSLGKVELIHRIEAAFGIEISDTLLAEAKSLNDIAEAILIAEPSIQKIHEITKVDLLKPAYDPKQANTLVEILFGRAAEDPNRPHVYLQNEEEKEKVITYQHLLEQSRLVAQGLVQYGVSVGDTVAIMLPTCEDFFYVFFGILLIGAIPVPIYPPLRPDKIEEYALREANILRNAEVKLLITFHQAERLSQLLRVFISSLQAVVTCDALRNNGKPIPKVEITSEMPVLIQYTSGSTSLPKGVLLSHYNLLSNMRAAGEAIQISPSDVGVSWLPLYHDMGLIGAWLTSFYYAIPVVIMSPLSFLSRPERWLWAIHYHRATLSAAPNFAYELCIRRIDEQKLKGLDLSSWRLSFNGAEAVNPRTIKDFTEKFAPYGLSNKTMFPVYGLAESTVALCFSPINREPKVDRIQRDAFELYQEAIPGTGKESYLEFVSCGSAIPLHELRVVDEMGSATKERKVGEIQFRGPSSMIGYYRQADETLKIKQNDWIISGDLGYIAEGELYITGRKKDMIIKAGRNYYPPEIEEVTSQIAGVRKGCVIAFGVSDQKAGTEKLVIVAETKDQNNLPYYKIKEEIIEKNAAVLDIVPDEIILVKARTIPKTSSGKLQRSACKQMYMDKKLARRQFPLWVQITKLTGLGLKQKALRWLKTAARFIYSLYIILLGCIGFCLVFPWVMLLPEKHVSSLIKIGVKTWFFLIGLPLHVEQEEDLTSVKAIYVANHASYMDGLVLLAVLPVNVKFVMKKELLKIPLLSGVLKKLKYIAVDRVDFLNSLADKEVILNSIQQNNALAFFPEGTFTRAPGLRPFKMGAFVVAAETNTPVFPVSLRGTRQILRGNNPLFDFGRIEIVIGKRIDPESAGWEGATRLHGLSKQFIAENCGELVLGY